MDEKQIETAEKIAEEHIKWFESVLVTINREHIGMLLQMNQGWMDIQSKLLKDHMIHGFKHGVEECTKRDK